ncbi:FecR domain-containing protein [Desulfovibrio sp. JC022]|uniref:FecR domain-containing protein n=1 Tax=Desulfovibrio sp. JC022 TaxID=2593642 RepID=UPI0013D1AA2C|nr:FecR domain-containing protein [Desulfovibrio sp. JC022]NDV22438.1 hypothetical protein [Desulfovibrio sp. JC022]
MPVEQSSPQEIGVVTGISGEAYAQTASGTRVLESGSPIYQGEELITGDNSNVEVRFVDDTLISQGGNSRIALDDYVYDPDGGDSSFLGEIAEGTFRTVTGKIAEQNPDRFKLGSPLATIGIRGTIILSEVTDDGEKHGVEEIHAGKAMLLQSKATGAMRQLLSGQMVDVSRSGLLSPVRSLAPQERDQFRKIAPENIRQEQDIRDQRDDDDQQDDDQNDEQNDEQQGEEGQQGEQQGELPGDVDPGGGTPGEEQGADGGALHPAKGVIDPGDDALIGQQRFDPDKIGQPPKPNEKPEVGEKDQQEKPKEGQEPEEPKNSEDEEQTGGEDGEKPKPVVEPVVEEADDDTGEKEDENDDESGDSGGSSSNPHDIHGSGFVEGTQDADTITGSSSADTVKGYGGNDTLYGESGNDTLFGGDGNDSMYGGTGADTLTGGKGSNYLDGGSSTDDIDFASYADSDHGVTVNLAGSSESTVTTDDFEDTLVNIEGIIGSSHQDNLKGDTNTNFFNPGMNEEWVKDSVGTYDVVNGGDGSEADWIQFDTLSSEYHLYGNMGSVISIKNSSNQYKGQVELINIENLIGSSGNDNIVGTTGTNVLKGGDGNDSFDGNCGNDTIYGDDGNDTIKGGENDDTIYGGTGNDSISGDLGNDSIEGGDGVDMISGGEGVDSIDGGDGIDSLTYEYITVGSDYGMDISLSASGTGTAKQVGASVTEDTFTNIEKILGTGTHDTFNGSEAADTFDGNEGDDIINGNGGNDWLNGDSGNDTIYGGAGDDFIKGGAGNNKLYGGTVGGASGDDTLSYEDHSSISVSMSDGEISHTISGTSYTDTIQHFATFIGSKGADTFIGNTDGDTFIGGKGDDYFLGKDGNNFFDGGAGTDKISFADAAGTVTVNINSSGGTASHDGYTDTFTNVESFVGSAHDDTFNGSSGNETFTGGMGDDTIYAGTGNDTLQGDAGTNLLDGQGGTMDYVSFADASSGINVTLNGTNEVTVSTGIGTDVIKNIEGIIGSGHQDNLEGDDNDNFFAPELNAEYISGNSATYESVTGGNGSDWIQFDTFDSSYHVVADLSSNLIYIKSGSTTVNKVVLDSIENIIGSAGNDIITASSVSASTIHGGNGTDTITLQDGKANTLVYTSLNEGGDTINNFENDDPTAANNDKFYFSGSDFDSAAKSRFTVIDNFDGHTGLSDNQSYFVYDSVNDKLYYDADGNDSNSATMIADIASGNDVTADDINFA